MFFYRQEHNNETPLTMLIAEMHHELAKAEYAFENNNISIKSLIHGTDILLLQEWVIRRIVKRFGEWYLTISLHRPLQDADVLLKIQTIRELFLQTKVVPSLLRIVAKFLSIYVTETLDFPVFPLD